ncbi:HAMP domain-containing sensor histidine kinase [Marinobacter sp. C7]|uniref:sensor histidine kinase n=1 Tax=Marinobacter sp. C7 TaxID=2951363 RepID=UPI001EEF936E|nr:HAMP domain-containing sensor histidine kinase [Marinobacter sp. C7]
MMFPLFWRIFLSIWLAMAVTVVASNLATRFLLDRERQAIERQVGLRDLGMEAIDVREQKGRGDAWRFLRSQGERLDLHLILVERDDEDDRLPEPIRERMRSSWNPQKPAVIDVTEDYRLVAWPRLSGGGWLEPGFFKFIEFGLASVLITLACWWIARLVSRPLKHMETTAKAISEGKNSLRVDEEITRRRDEIGRLASAFNAMTDQLCNLLDRQTQLLRDISHDLRTPLARQRVAIELASESGADAPLMASILRQNERLEAMTSQILTLYRVTEQGEAIDRLPVEPLPLVNRVLEDAADFARHQQVDCRLVAAPDVVNLRFMGDPGLLQRAVDNILQNALDHTPRGKSVHLTLKNAARQMVLEIRDEGPGVPEELLGQLFEPFFRADKSRGGKGWGLGLAIARDIVAAHDGTITAGNSEEGGLSVTIRLPVFSVG